MATTAARSEEARRNARLAIGYRSVVGRRSDASSSNQLPDTSTTRRCARVAPQDVYYDGRRKDPGLLDLVGSDGGIVYGGEFVRFAYRKRGALRRRRLTAGKVDHAPFTRQISIPVDVPSARWPGRCARLASDPDVRLRRRIAQRGRVLRGDMTPTAEQAAPVRSAHERTLAPEEVAGRAD